ncbi:MAG: response regulator [bacterium]
MNKTRERILIIDDNQNILDTLSDLLTERGYDVTCALDGASGLRKVEEFLFGVVIIDLGLPDYNGMEVMKMIRAKNKRIVIIIITGNTSKETPVDAMNNGAFNYIVKPYSPKLICETIDKAVEQHRLKIQNSDLIKKLNHVIDDLKQKQGEKTNFWTAFIKELHYPLTMVNTHLNILHDLIRDEIGSTNSIEKQEKIINVIQLNIKRILNLALNVNIEERPNYIDDIEEKYTPKTIYPS